MSNVEIVAGASEGVGVRRPHMSRSRLSSPQAPPRLGPRRNAPLATTTGSSAPCRTRADPHALNPAPGQARRRRTGRHVRDRRCWSASQCGRLVLRGLAPSNAGVCRGLLAADGEVPVVVISASAGSGKSILAAQWSAQCQRPIALLTLESSDNDPVVLLAAELREELSRSLAVPYGMAQRPRGRRKGTDVGAEAEAG
jgi:hypothetical protein